MANPQSTLQKIPVLRGLRLKTEDCELFTEKEPDNGAPIFVAVHGTWGSRSTWTSQKSELFKALLGNYPGAGLYRFQWSATNGIRHRLLAAQKLHDELNVLLDRYPLSDVVAISHSHGGNVVAWASKELRRPLFASVYLSTPFINILGNSWPAYGESSAFIATFMDDLAFFCHRILGCLDYSAAP